MRELDFCVAKRLREREYFQISPSTASGPPSSSEEGKKGRWHWDTMTWG